MAAIALSRRVSRSLLLLSLFLLVVFLLFLIGQTADVVAAAGRLHPVLGDGVLWGLVFVYVGCGLVPILLLLRLPAPLTPPEHEHSPEFERHLETLADRLAQNPRLPGRTLESRADVEAALKSLDGEADEVISQTAGQVFLTTAVSQNGSLDSLLVLATQARMVWQVAHVYYQRPGPRQLAYLYSNVVTTAFVAGQLEDVDLSEQIGPLVTSSLGTAAGAIPGLQATGGLVANSLFSGAANAFLTLRVGVIAKRYCGALVLPEKGVLRRFAAASAARMLGPIVVAGAKQVTRAVGRYLKRKPLAAARAGTDWMSDTATRASGAASEATAKARDAGANVADRVKDAAGSVGERLSRRKRSEEDESDQGDENEVPTPRR